MMIPQADMLYRIAAGAVLGGVIGFERDIHGRHVGLRTHLIVAMTAATFMVVSSQFVYFQQYSAKDLVVIDASRIAASVVTAVGFLAGGAILKNGATIQGITTSAGLWLVTSIGLAAGAGMYVEAIGATLLGLFALTFLRVLEDKDGQPLRRRVSIIMADNKDTISAIIARLDNTGIKLSDFDYERKVGEKKVNLHFEARIPVNVGVNRLIEELENHDGIESIHVREKN